MFERQTLGSDLAQGAGRFVGHVLALVIGLVLMAVGLALGVSMVLLPVGIPVGLAGLGLFLWGLVGRSRAGEVPTPPAGQP